MLEPCVLNSKVNVSRVRDNDTDGSKAAIIWCVALTPINVLLAAESMLQSARLRTLTCMFQIGLVYLLDDL